MKKLLFIILLSLLLSSMVVGQILIWSEDMTYVDGTTEGMGVPPKWTIDVTNCSFDPDDYFEIRSNLMEGKDLDGEAIWTSEMINISSYSDVAIQVDLNETGTLEAYDYIRVYYKVDGAGEILFAMNGDNSDDFDSRTASQTGLNGSSLTLMVKMKNNANTEFLRFDDIRVEGIPINLPPVISGAQANQSISDKQTIHPFLNVVLSDPTGDDILVTVILDNIGKGSFTSASLAVSGFYGPAGSSYSLGTTTTANAQAAIRQLVFSPAENRVAPGSTETTQFIISINDGVSITSDNSTTVITTSVNDPPEIHKINDQNIMEDSETEKISIIIDDPDNESHSIIGWAYDKILVPNSHILFNRHSDPMTVKIIPAENQYGETWITLRISDASNYHERRFKLTVTPINDPPAFINLLPEIQLARGCQYKGPLCDWFNCVEDPDNPDESLSWQINNKNHVTASIMDDSVSITAPSDWTGTDTLQVVVSDNDLCDTSFLFVHVFDTTGQENEENSTGIKHNGTLPTEFTLAQNYPNPFNPSTTIEFALPQRAHVTLMIYDLMGHEVTRLVNETRNAGTYTSQWDASRVSAGVYVYKLQADRFVQIRKCILMK